MAPLFISPILNTQGNAFDVHLNKLLNSIIVITNIIIIIIFSALGAVGCDLDNAGRKQASVVSDN